MRGSKISGFLAASSFLLLASITARGARPPSEKDPDVRFSIPWVSEGKAFFEADTLGHKPAGALGRICVRNGHLAFERGGRARFWGVNLSGGACFPPREIVPKLVERIRRFGFNLVRLHGMDASWGRGIFDRRFNDTRHLDPEQLKRLDYLTAELKRQGIYINMNLHVGRRFKSGDGLPQTQWLSYAKYTTIFDRRMIELQKEYAKKLLGHVNLYTGLSYAKDPSVIIVELTNENSLFGGWTRGFLRGRQRERPRSGWTDIPPYYAEELTALFNKWLKKRYGDRRKLASVWNQGARRAGPQLLRNGEFEAGKAGWELSVRGKAGAKFEVVRQGGGACGKVTVSSTGAKSWYVMLTQRPLELKGGERYSVSFRARAVPPRRLYAEVCRLRPYEGYGSAGFQVGEKWRQFRFSFKAPREVHPARLSFHFARDKGEVWIDSVVLQSSAVLGLGPGEDPEAGTVRRLAPEDFQTVTEARFRDEARFYFETECAYYKEMAEFLRKEVGVEALIEGTNHNYGLPCLWAESTLDLMDCHAYWQHPHFPRRPWSRTDWTIGNSAMLDSPRKTTIAALCRSAVSGKPFTVSEYNHPFPNEYACEMPLLIAAYGALQDWDAVYLYTFCHRYTDRELSGDVVTGYFDICNEVTKLAQMPVASVLFRRGDVRAARKVVEVQFGTNHIFDSLKVVRWRRGFELEGELSPLLPLVHRYRVKAFGASRTTRASEIGFKEPQGTVVSDTGELKWHRTEEKRNYLTIDTDRVQAALGWIGGKKIKLKNVEIEVETPFCAVSVVSLDGLPVGSSKRLLVTAVARCANTGMKWNPERTSISDRWGGPPLLIEPVAGSIFLKRDPGAPALLLRLLDYTGSAKPQSEPFGGVLRLPERPETVWYALEARR